MSQKYRINYKTGVTFTANAKTLLGAKKEASANANVGFGCCWITEGDNEEPTVIMYECNRKWIIPGID